ncbi:hypothetical protein TRVL_09695 [Trypanosoma vivax]|nr:hypothetical protein TRVL_09695 [Trypanosoma vivax]
MSAQVMKHGACGMTEAEWKVRSHFEVSRTKPQLCETAFSFSQDAKQSITHKKRVDGCPQAARRGITSTGALPGTRITVANTSLVEYFAFCTDCCFPELSLVITCRRHTAAHSSIFKPTLQFVTECGTPRVHSRLSSPQHAKISFFSQPTRQPYSSSPMPHVCLQLSEAVPAYNAASKMST